MGKLNALQVAPWECWHHKTLSGRLPKMLLNERLHTSLNRANPQQLQTNDRAKDVRLVTAAEKRVTPMTQGTPYQTAIMSASTRVRGAVTQGQGN